MPQLPEFFEHRERALLGDRFPELFAPATAEPARGVTVNTLRTTPRAFAEGMDVPLTPSPFCNQAFAVPAALQWEGFVCALVGIMTGLGSWFMLAPEPGSRQSW